MTERLHTPVTLEFDGTTIKLNGTAIKKNDVYVTADRGKWYKIVLSADKTTESCFAKVYDLDNNLVGETGSVAWTETSEPTYYSIGCENKVTGTIDFDAYKAYYSTADTSTYTLSVSQKRCQYLTRTQRHYPRRLKARRAMT